MEHMFFNVVHYGNSQYREVQAKALNSCCYSQGVWIRQLLLQVRCLNFLYITTFTLSQSSSKSYFTQMFNTSGHLAKCWHSYMLTDGCISYQRLICLWLCNMSSLACDAAGSMYLHKYNEIK